MQTQPQFGSRINRSHLNCANNKGIRSKAPQSSAIYSSPPHSTLTHSDATMSGSEPQSQPQHFEQPSIPPPPPPPSVSLPLPINQLTLIQMESIISPLTKRRSENFMKQEVMQLIQEIEKRCHIILSRDPSDRQLKKKAWKEVANSMALKCPHEPRRTGEQVRGWSN